LPVDLILHNAKVYTKKGLIEGGVAVDNGRIVKIAKKTNLPEAANRMNLRGKLALPGLIDSHVHLRDQQLAYREDFTSGTSAAAAGGVTTVLDMPNNQPTTMSAEALRERMRLAEPRILVNVAFNSAFPKETDETGNIVAVGAVGFKLYLLQQIGGVNIDDDEALLNALKSAKNRGRPVCVHAEDRSTLEEAERKLKAEGKHDIAAFLKAHPDVAEKKAIARITAIARKSSAHVHICHVSSAMGLREVLRAKRRDTAVTCEVAPHHLLLSTRHLKTLGNIALELPPLRTSRDISALWRGLHSGGIDTIASDHAPHSWEEKTPKSVWDVKPGIAGLETMLPLMLTEVDRGRLTLRQLVRLTCHSPSRIFGFNDRGTLDKGCNADITIVDLKKRYRIDASRFYSKAKFSPFDGWKVKGRPVQTLVNGQLVMDEGDIVAKPGTGRLIK
jgi:dihydroorotase (multifunctional complex type)